MQGHSTWSGAVWLLSRRLQLLEGLLLLLLLLSAPPLLDCQLTGTIATCDLQSGSPILIPGISDDPCIKCVCQNREVICVKEKCPDLYGCRVIPYSQPSARCCDTCKGCVFEGHYYTSDTTWKDSRNPCKIFSCQAGVLSESILQCHFICKNPRIVPDQCCPVCPGCKLNGQEHAEGDIFLSPDDKCSVCRCENSTLTCEKYGCPVPNCSRRHYERPDNRTCCGHCIGSRKVYEPPKGACLFRNKVLSNGSRTQVDSCTQCTCVAGTMVCQSRVCPPLYCKTTDIVSERKSCCPRCKVAYKGCRDRRTVYKHGQVWKSDHCTHCLCDAGVIRCQVEQCTWKHLECPPNTRPMTTADKCCPQCVDVEAVCAVFGDPHYRTFDGKLFNFQGKCNYVLAEECSVNSSQPVFSVRVRNEARSSSHYSWTKSVTVIFGGSRIKLLQKYRVKVDRTRVQLPFQHWTNNFSITMGSSAVKWTAYNGVKVVWDGNSYLEVSVPPAFKNRMCGLCGNYNNQEQDDFRGRDGEILYDSARFGDTWRVEGASCRSLMPSDSSSVTCSSSEARQRKATRQCGVLYANDFEKCRELISVQDFFVSCLTDVCDCPRGKQCACESITAYSRACSREGVDIKWKSEEFCGVPKCPSGSRWHACTSQCPLTCKNHRLLSICKKPCQPGCQCRPGLVFHEDRCIPPRKCPLKRNNKRKKKIRRKKAKFSFPFF